MATLPCVEWSLNVDAAQREQTRSVAADADVAMRDSSAPIAMAGASSSPIAPPTDGDTDVLMTAAPSVSAPSVSIVHTAWTQRFRRVEQGEPRKFFYSLAQLCIFCRQASLDGLKERTETVLKQKQLHFAKKESELQSAHRDETAVARMLRHKDRVLSDLEWRLHAVASLFEHRVSRFVFFSKLDNIVFAAHRRSFFASCLCLSTRCELACESSSIRRRSDWHVAMLSSCTK